MSANLPSFEIANLRHPSQGARCLQLPFDFSIAAILAGDLLLELENGHIDIIQSAYIDNADNGSAFSLTIPGVGQHGYRIVVPPYTQAMREIVLPVGKLSYSAQSLGGVIVPVTFFNIPFPYFQATSIAVPAPLITGTETDHSGTIAVANVSQLAIPANANRKRVVIQNPGLNVGSIWIRNVVAATEDEFSQEIMPGQEFDTGGGPLVLGDINVIGATLAATYMAKEIHA